MELALSVTFFVFPAWKTVAQFSCFFLLQENGTCFVLLEKTAFVPHVGKNPPAENQISSPTLRKIVIRTKHKHNVLTKSDIIVQEKSMRESASADVIFVAS